MVKRAYIMWLSKNRTVTVVALLMLLLWNLSMGQLVKVKDSVFAQALCDKLPLAMNETCDSLDVSKATSEYPASNNKAVFFSDLGIHDASEIVYFTGLDKAYFNKNQLTQVPDLSQFTAMTWLNFNENLLTEAPDLFLPNLSNLIWMYFAKNQVSSLESWNGKNHPNIQSIHMGDNKLTELPELYTYPKLSILKLENNYLTFSSLVPLLSSPKFSSNFVLFPQKELSLLSHQVRQIGEDWVISIDHDHSANRYELYKNGVKIRESSNGVFNLTDLSLSDQGEYHVIIRNSNFSATDEFLTTNTVSLDIADDKSVGDVSVFSPDGDGVADFILLQGSGEFEIFDESGTSVLNGTLPYSWVGTNKSGQPVAPGMFYVKKPDGTFQKILLTF